MNAHSEKPKIWQPIPLQVTLWRGCDSGGVLPRHAHEEFQIVLSDVPCEFSYRCSNTVLSPRHLGLIQSGEPHASRSDDSTGHTLRLMFFSPEILLSTAETLDEFSELPILPNLIVSDALLIEQFLHMHTTLEETPSQLECETLIFEFLTQLILRCAENPPSLQVSQESAIVKQVREYLQDNYAENVSLTQLAQTVDRTPAHLVRVFSKEVGLPPHVYQTQVRIARAKTLLMQGHLVATVAQATGFADHAHFSRQFKRLNGITPKQYRQNIKNVQDLLD
ncbi:helix-turn-helix transcriptional regulator [Cyanobacteria bacterium FACHB-471]|nr:helix-turn-helix transcriptional regulator [Cyanobacteria bacterium FACHB-471]